MNPAIEKLEKEIALGKETKGHCVILGWPLTGKMLKQQVLVLESLKACVEALEEQDATHFRGKRDAALTLVNRAMGVSQ